MRVKNFEKNFFLFSLSGNFKTNSFSFFFCFLDCLKRIMSKAMKPLLENENQTGVQIPIIVQNHGLVPRVGSAIFYGLSSFLITVLNKMVLTSYKFPSFQVLGLGQMTMTVVVLYLSKKLKILEFPSFDRTIIWKIWPLPLIYVGNMVFGLGGTKELSLPMFTALRRFSILMTMISEYYILNVKPKLTVQLAVYLMVIGALIAASNDLAFTLEGYVFVLLNDFFTATNGVYMKQKLDSKELGKYGLMFYNSFFMIFPSFLLCWITGDLDLAVNYPDWKNSFFLFAFFLSCTMGFILMYSIIICTHYNSALTTTIIGSLKNISITYLGMVIGGDYIFSMLNFVGINVSVLGSLIYTYVTFRKPDKPKVNLDEKTNIKNRINEV